MRLVLVDTIAQLPDLLPLHAWSALMGTDVVLVMSADHPLRQQLEAADVAVEVVPSPPAGGGVEGMSRTDLLSGVSLADKRRAGWITDRVRARGEVSLVLSGASEAFVRTLGLDAARAGVEVEMVYLTTDRRGTAVLDLVALERRLRGPDGCPWDAEQDHASLAPFAVEEVHELVDAIATGDRAAIRDELGDVLLQVVFHAQIADEAGHFDIDDVARGIVDKLVRRHPHVFGGPQADEDPLAAAEVMTRWHELKASEQPERTGMFDGVVVGRDPLGLAGQVQRRAARRGFDWTDDEEALAAVIAETDEVAHAHGDRVGHELGDLLFAVVSLCRHRGVDPDQALRAAVGRFRRRLEHIEATSRVPLDDLGRDDWLAAWASAKAREG